MALAKEKLLRTHHIRCNWTSFSESGRGAETKITKINKENEIEREENKNCALCTVIQ